MFRHSSKTWFTRIDKWKTMPFSASTGDHSKVRRQSELLSAFLALMPQKIRCTILLRATEETLTDSNMEDIATIMQCTVPSRAACSDKEGDTKTTRKTTNNRNQIMSKTTRGPGTRRADTINRMVVRTSRESTIIFVSKIDSNKINRTIPR